jgi:hypothetical protein
MPKPASVTLPEAAVENMNPVARQHLPEHLQGNFLVGTDFEGATIGYSFVTQHGILPAQDLTVGPYIELPEFPGSTNDLGSLNIFNNTLLIYFDKEASFEEGGFYGPVLTDPYNEVSAITSVVLTENGGSEAFTQSDIILFSPDEVRINLAGTHFAAGSEIVISFYSFAPSSGGDLLFG